MAEGCVGRIFRNYHWRGCGKPAKAQDPDGWHCGTHSNAAVERRKIAKDQRRKERTAKWDREAEARRKAKAERAETERRAACYDTLLAALEEVCKLHGPGYLTRSSGDAAVAVARTAIEAATGKDT